MTFDFNTIKPFLTCPVTKSDLVWHDSSLVCCDPGRRLLFPVEDEIPRLMEVDSVELDEETWKEIMTQNHRDSQTGNADSNG